MKPDCKMLIDENRFKEFQEIAFSLGYDWINQSIGEHRVVTKSEIGIGIILSNKRIYGAYSTGKLSSWGQSHVDIVQMHQFIKFHKNEPEKKNTISVTVDKLMSFFSKQANKDGVVELPLDVAKKLNMDD